MCSSFFILFFERKSLKYVVHYQLRGFAQSNLQKDRIRIERGGCRLGNLPRQRHLLSCSATGGRWRVNVFHWGGAHWLTGGKLHGIQENICQREPLGAGAVTQIPERRWRQRWSVRDAERNTNRGQRDRPRVRNSSPQQSVELCGHWLNPQLFVD